jgi:putative transposase
MMQDVGRRYVRVLNNLRGRTGTLWEGRYRSSLVQDERYLLTVHRYIELNPVYAGMVAHPARYPWSSHAHYAGTRADPLIREHGSFLGLAMTPEARREAFMHLFTTDIDAETRKKIQDAIEAGCPVGAEPPKRGRPTAAQPGVPAPVSGKLF